MDLYRSRLEPAVGNYSGYQENPFIVPQTQSGTGLARFMQLTVVMKLFFEDIEP
jgi:hypothetical protein